MFFSRTIFLQLIHPLSFSTPLYFQWDQSDQTVYCADFESWFVLILCAAPSSLVCMCAFPEWGGLPGGVRLWWHQHPQCLCAFWYLGGRHQEKGPTWAEKKEKYVYCLHSLCSAVCFFSLQNPIEIPQNQTVWLWVTRKLKFIFLSFVCCGNVFWRQMLFLGSHCPHTHTQSLIHI